MSHRLRSCVCAVLAFGASACWGEEAARTAVPPKPHGVQVLGLIQGMGGSVTVDPDGSYSIISPDIPGAVIHSDVEAVVDGRVLRSSPTRCTSWCNRSFSDDGGTGSSLTVTHTGLPGTPDLVCTLRLFRDRSWGEIEVKVQNGDGWSHLRRGDPRRACNAGSGRQSQRAAGGRPHPVRQLQRGSAATRDS